MGPNPFLVLLLIQFLLILCGSKPVSKELSAKAAAIKLADPKGFIPRDIA